jgi:hypothetical protein
MSNRWIRRLLASSLLLLAAAPQLKAQLSNLAVTGHTGVAVPFGVFADYASLGGTAGVEVEYPVTELFDVVVNGDLDLLNGKAPGVPDLTLLRYQAGIQSEVLGRASENWGLRAHLGAGATTFRSKTFYPQRRPVSERFRETYFTGSAGLELVFAAASSIHGFVGTRVHWTPMKEGDTEPLKNAALVQLDPLKSALHAPVTLGLRIRTS